MLTDSHNHTMHYSGDASMTIDELINASIALNLPRIAITEHYDLDYPHPEEPDMCFDINSYSESFKEWRNLSTKLNGPELLMGIEIGYQDHLIERIEKDASSADFDSVILSNHLFDGIDVYFNKDCYKLSPEERNSRYIGTMADMCERINNFDIAAHYDYINRYNPDFNQEVLYSHCPKEFDRLFNALISKNKALEINTKSIDVRIKNKCDNVWPDRKIIERYIELGGKLITLGSDSHKPDTLNNLFDETSKYLKSLGVNRICYFKKRKPVFQDI